MLDKHRPGLTPGVHLRAEIERLGLDQVAVASATGVSRQTINNIVNDRQAISRAMAAKLGRLTGRSSDYWLQSSFPGPAAAPADAAGTQAGTAVAATSDAGIRPLGVAVLVNHQIIRAVEQGVFVVEPFNRGNVQRASLDLTLDDFIVTTDGERVDISEDTYPLKVGQTVNVGTREWIEFPLDYIARVGAMTEHAKFGLMTSHGFQVDPGFCGNLQFCLFNAGQKSFVLQSAMPIISLEIMPLVATPSPDERAADHVRAAGDRDTVISRFRDDACGRLIREAIGKRVNVAAAHEGFCAKVPELDIELIETSADAALDAAVTGALRGLQPFVTDPSAAVEGRERFIGFFGEIAERLYLSAEQVLGAAACLGLDPNGDKANPVVTLPNGTSVSLQVPPNSAKITLRHLARQLRRDPGDLMLTLSGLSHGSRE
jgi:addiction module HigA family antidote